jgi:hypothetical protein
MQHTVRMIGNACFVDVAQYRKIEQQMQLMTIPIAEKPIVAPSPNAVNVSVALPV